MVKTQLIGSGWVSPDLLLWDAPLDRDRAEAPEDPDDPDDVAGRFAGVERAEADRFAGPFDALFGVRVAMMPKVRRRHRVKHRGSPTAGGSREFHRESTSWPHTARI
jgi:hypothetical protein